MTRSALALPLRLATPATALLLAAAACHRTTPQTTVTRQTPNDTVGSPGTELEFAL